MTILYTDWGLKNVFPLFFSLTENVSVDENSDSKDDKDGDAKDQKKGDMNNELDIDFENFFCPETPCLEELANSDYIHNRYTFCSLYAIDLQEKCMKFFLQNIFQRKLRELQEIT
ncbi:hypothetical protein TNCT_715881 [Trichonephila clavata]|uniref:Uncharacterized protein n=1 Tax=Trichonephila clavata TaxID=2740835 RepID=A0A8X6JJ20_TRICU|nr:hypothetical protein TNCT_715881 [Trichonephila clavata]